jgi:hypothetical protein
MSVYSIIRIRNITIFVWTLMAVFIGVLFFTPESFTKMINIEAWGGTFFILNLILCYGFAYKLDKTKCPDCNEYMFRGGKFKYSIEKFLYRQCGQCGFKLKKELER